MKKSIDAQWVSLVLAVLTAVIPILISVAPILPPQWQKDYPWLPSTILAALTVAFIVLGILQARESQQNEQPSKPISKPLSPYIIGPPIHSPANFFGRQAEVERFFAHLNGPQPQPLQVLGLRRAGKTSFLRYVSHPLVVRQKARDAARTLIIYNDLQAGIKTAADFYLKLAEGINRSLPEASRLALPRRGFPKGTFSAFSEWLDSRPFADYRLIILLDEFEALLDEAAFDADFFRGLRSLSSHRLAWVTTSYRDLYRLSRILAESDKHVLSVGTAPFFNIFHPTPLILGGLSTLEADDLIQKPATSVGVLFSSQEIVSIKQLAGRLPFFLQMGAEAWFNAKQQGLPLREIKAKVRREFSSAMSNHFDWYWRHFSSDERTLLAHLAPFDRLRAVPLDCSAYRQEHGLTVLNDLLNYGLIAKACPELRLRKGETYCIAGQVFAEWIRRRISESG